MSLVTRCPVCATAFRVQRGQLGARGGKVRCGKCGQIFDGISSLVEEGVEPLKIEPSPQLGLFDSSRRASTVEEDVTVPAFMADEEPSRRGAILWGLLAFIAVLALAGQVVHRYRSEILAQVPASRAFLTAFCRAAGCQLTLPRHAAEMSVESSDLQADGRREGVMVLNALLKNRGALAQEYPALELTLTDEGGNAVLRRVLTPRDYLDPNRTPEQGIAPGDEVALRIYLDASRVRATGFKLRSVYP